MFVKPAVKLSHMGRRSGGVITLVRKQLTTVVENTEVDFDNILLRKLSGSVFNVDGDVFLICCYVCPQHSPYYRDKDFKCGLQLVEECIMYVNEKYDCPYVFVCGDLNSRTADRNNYSNNDVPDENSDSESEAGGRKSTDKTVNTFGAELLDMCCIHKMRILNGDCDGDREGEFTFVSHSGSSVNDYYFSCVLGLSRVQNSAGPCFSTC